LKKSKLLVLTSRWEGYPNVLVQGMTLNKKIIATACYGSSKAVLGNNGTIIATKKPVVFANGISKVYKTNNFYKKYKQVNQIKHNINKFLELF
jgi:glycosyltransferase involved in cell wall biosynthesis